jgi:NodT family efflux transporter outer membrane factor (OMF) lipoprotein
VDYRRFEYEATRLNLIANITTAAITRARLFEQEEALNATVLLQEKQLEITRDRIRFGQASQDDMLSLQAQVEQARSEAIMLRKQRGEIEHLLAMLSGHTPSEVQIHAFRLSDFTLPTDLPLVVPSQLVRQRPDIQASEALLHVANADYGVAISKLYPQINLSANLSAQALSTGTLFNANSTVWNVIGQITQPLFNPGLPAEKRAALAAFDAAAANYKSVVVEAFRNVADTLNAIENDAQNLRALTIANNAAQTSLKSVQRQYDLGSASYLQLLVAEQQARQIEIGTIAAQAQRLMDSVLLYQAIGGGF